MALGEGKILLPCMCRGDVGYSCARGPGLQKVRGEECDVREWEKGDGRMQEGRRLLESHALRRAVA